MASSAQPAVRADASASLLLPQGPLPASQLALYRHLHEVLRTAILARPEGAEGVALPSEGDLAQRYGVSRITVRQAMQMLEAEGLIRRQRGRPAAVQSALPSAGAVDRELGSLDDLMKGGQGRTIRVRSFRQETHPPAAGVFGAPDATPLRCLRLDIRRDGRVIGCSTIHFAPSVGPSLKRADFTDVFVFRTLQRRLRLRVDTARVTLRAEAADEEAAAVLGCAAGAPLLSVNFVFRAANGVPVQVTRSRFLAEAYAVSYDIHALDRD